MRGPRTLLSALAAFVALAFPGVASAQADLEGITWSVFDGGPNGPDLISGAIELPEAPPQGTPLCGALQPTFPVTGEIIVQDSTGTGTDSAVGNGNVPAFGGGVGAPFQFSAHSGPLGENPTGTFNLGFPTGRESQGDITCLQVVGQIAYIAGRRRFGEELVNTPGKATGGGQIPGASPTSRISFGFEGISTQGETPLDFTLRGKCTVEDPARNTSIRCLDVTGYTQVGTHATLRGTAKVNGQPTEYVINVDDLGEPNRGVDMFKIVTASGYEAAGNVPHGDVQVFQEAGPQG